MNPDPDFQLINKYKYSHVLHQTNKLLLIFLYIDYSINFILYLLHKKKDMPFFFIYILLVKINFGENHHFTPYGKIKKCVFFCFFSEDGKNTPGPHYSNLVLVNEHYILN